MFLKTLNNIKAILGTTLVWLAALLSAQAQSVDSFSSLQQPSFAKIAGLGGVNTSIFNGGSGFFIYNPALLADVNDNHLMVSYGFLPGGTGLANVNYGGNYWGIHAIPWLWHHPGI